MAMGSLALACALVVANVDLPDICYWPQSNFAIPVRVAPDKRASVKELRLFVSRDQGATWSHVATETPDKTRFSYKTSADGQYWFIVATVDLKNQQTPIDIYNSPVNQRILVDTLKPEVVLDHVERSGDEVRIKWEIREDNPDLNTFRMEYRAADQSTTWTPINVRPALKGEAAFRVAVAGPVQVRLLMSDLAGNPGQAERDAATTTVAALPTDPTISAPPPVPPPPTFGEPAPVMPPPPSGNPVSAYRESQPTEPPAPRQFNRGAEENFANRQPAVPGGSFVEPRTVAQSPIQPTSGVDRPSASIAPTLPASRVGMPPVELVNKPTARIEFQVGKYGPSGLGSVDVYVSTDDGANWTLSTTDRNVTLPSPDEMRSRTPVTGSVQVELKEEGVVHSFYIVVKSKAGLGKKAPDPGTPPQVRIELDMTSPVVELYKPQPDPNHRDTLLLSWKATDKNIAGNPVTIEWAAQRDAREGQWNVIGMPEMANTGQFSWQVPGNVPPSVYLRLSVRDAAGNRAVAQTPEPELVDLSVPETVGFRVAH